MTEDDEARWQQPERVKIVQRLALLVLALAALGDILLDWDDVFQKALLYGSFAVVAATGVYTIAMRQRHYRDRQRGSR